jgi:hypothetical protein
MDSKTLKIQQLNDQFRRQVGADWYMSQGVAELPHEKKLQLLALVINFNLFDEGNDPYGEHDFGQVKLDGVKYFWKCDSFSVNHGESP